MSSSATETSRKVRPSRHTSKITASMRNPKPFNPALPQGVKLAQVDLINKRYYRAQIHSTDNGHQVNACAPLALSIILNKPFSEINAWLKSLGARKSDTTGTYTHRVLDESNGFKKVTYSYPKWKTLAAFARNEKSGKFLVMVDSHVVAVIDGVLYNTFAGGRRSRIKSIYQYTK